MRVSITHRQETLTAKPRGLFDRFKTLKSTTYYNVDTTIDLSEEERAILDKYDLWDKVLFNLKLPEQPDNPSASEAERLVASITHSDFTIEEVLDEKPFTRWFYSPIEAENFAHRMETEILPNLKKYITQSHSATRQGRTFEL
jgi:hypothetical protein